MRVSIVSATVEEWMPCFLKLDTLYTSDSKRLKVSFQQSGVGLLASSVTIMKLIIDEKPDLILQAGIAGTFDKTVALGEIVVIKEEVSGDLGVEEEGKWKDVFDLKLEKSNYPPYEKRRLPNHWLEQFNLLHLHEVTGLTVNEISTNKERIQQLKKKYNPITESMEGAALHYVAGQMNTPFIQIRAISNYVGERNKSNWKIKEAIENLNRTLIKYVERLYKIA